MLSAQLTTATLANLLFLMFILCAIILAILAIKLYHEADKASKEGTPVEHRVKVLQGFGYSMFTVGDTPYMAQYLTQHSCEVYSL